MDSKSLLRRDFIETCLKLKRDSILLMQANLVSNLTITLDYNVVIGFNVSKNTWTKNGEDWNPSVTKVCNLIDSYDETDVMLAIAKFEEDSVKAKKNINSTLLIGKLNEVVTLIANKQTENNVPGPTTIISTNKYDFAVVENNFVYKKKQDTNYQLITINEVVANLNIDYIDMFEALNTAYSEING